MAKRAVAGFSHADVDLATTLENLEGADNYAEWIFSLVRPHLGDDVLEVGAGHGTITEKLASHCRRTVAGDLSDRCVATLQHRFGDNEKVEIYRGRIGDAAPYGPFDTAVLVNVLEHIEHDDAAIAELHDLLSPGGRLIIWVPAFESLYSDFDRRIGHYRRYRRGQLRAQVHRAGFGILECRYVNTVGALAWLVLARWMRRMPTAAGPVRIYDKYFVPVLRRVEQTIPTPIGQSLFVVAVKVPETVVQYSPEEAR